MCSEATLPIAALRGGGPRPPWPSTIELHRPARTVEMVWGEERAVLTHRALRLACRCADCESRRRQGRADALSGDAEIVRIEFVGESGLRLFFADGHDRGIFPWSYLYRLAFIRPGRGFEEEEE